VYGTLAQQHKYGQCYNKNKHGRNFERIVHSVNLGLGVKAFNVIWNRLKFTFGPTIFLSKLFVANSST
jgi:hypothetical protein